MSIFTEIEQKFIDLLGYGKDNAIKAKVLMRVLNIKDDRIFRDLVHSVRCKKAQVLASHDSINGGYYLADSEDELTEFKANRRYKLLNELRMIDKMEYKKTL